MFEINCLLRLYIRNIIDFICNFNFCLKCMLPIANYSENDHTIFQLFSKNEMKKNHS